jgi:hypothetical protein
MAAEAHARGSIVAADVRTPHSVRARAVAVEGSCVYHTQAPVFHEGAKKWVCCGCTKYDFDDFLKVPGCATGKHEPVE